MEAIKIIDDCMVCGLGIGHQEVLSQIQSEKSAIHYQEQWDAYLSLFPKQWHEYVSEQELLIEWTCLQKHVAAFIIYWASTSNTFNQILQNPSQASLFWSSTKGGLHDGIYELSDFLFPIASHFGFKSAQQRIISTACVSGVLAIQEAAKWLQVQQESRYAIVIGLDFIGDFIIDGFQSFRALSTEICKPFHADRNGLNLGEAMAGMLLTNDTDASSSVLYLGGGSSNDANHLSGPSRTGEELGHAIRKSYASYSKDDIDLIVAHGTATPYNDGMEVKAFAFSGLKDLPIWAPKYYLGHSLGASGLIETLIVILLLKHQVNLTHPYFESSDKIIDNKKLFEISEEQSRSYKFVKTAAGFGGCNAAILIQVSNE